METDIGKIHEVWKQQDVPLIVIKVTAENWDKYPPSVQAMIEVEAKRRGLWERILDLREGKTEVSVSAERNSRRKQYLELAVLACLIALLFAILGAV